jgi:hypothetical protein
MTSEDERRDGHRRYLAYLERFDYFGRGGMKRLTAAEFRGLEEKLADPATREVEAQQIRKLLLRD